MDSDMLCGELVKKGQHGGRGWKARLFKFDSNATALMEYDCSDKRCQTPLAILKCGEAATPPVVKALSVQQAQRTNAFSVTADSQTWVLAAPKPKARDTWMQAIKEADPFHAGARWLVGEKTVTISSADEVVVKFVGADGKEGTKAREWMLKQAKPAPAKRAVFAGFGKRPAGKGMAEAAEDEALFDEVRTGMPPPTPTQTTRNWHATTNADPNHSPHPPRPPSLHPPRSSTACSSAPCSSRRAGPSRRCWR
jgi:hypothetical protein